MAFEELYLVSPRVAPLDAVSVDALLAECELDAPGGYREFLTRFGLGEVCRFLSLLAPDDVRSWCREVGAFMLDEGLHDSSVYNSCRAAPAAEPPRTLREGKLEKLRRLLVSTEPGLALKPRPPEAKYR
jgi:hypothetical protein